MPTGRRNPVDAAVHYLLFFRGKRGGARTLIAFRQGEKAFFMYGYPKNERANIDSDELKALRFLAKELLGYSPQGLVKAIRAGELIEVTEHGKE